MDNTSRVLLYTPGLSAHSWGHSFEKGGKTLILEQLPRDEQRPRPMALAFHTQLSPELLPRLDLNATQQRSKENERCAHPAHPACGARTISMGSVDTSETVAAQPPARPDHSHNHLGGFGLSGTVLISIATC